MHTILGANGAIGQELSRALASSSKPIRQVGRNPRRVNQTDEVVAADLLDSKAIAGAVSVTTRTTRGQPRTTRDTRRGQPGTLPVFQRNMKKY